MAVCVGMQNLVAQQLVCLGNTGRMPGTFANTTRLAILFAVILDVAPCFRCCVEDSHVHVLAMVSHEHSSVEPNIGTFLNRVTLMASAIVIHATVLVVYALFALWLFARDETASSLGMPMFVLRHARCLPPQICQAVTMSTDGRHTLRLPARGLR